jgi:hypothetical protein
MERLSVPVPPNLEAAFGYDSGDAARCVAFYWEPCGDELAFDDGRYGVVGANWEAWQAFLQHPAVSRALLCRECKGRGMSREGGICRGCDGLCLRFNLGSGDEEAAHCLVLDRRERALYAAPRGEAMRLLAGQWAAGDVRREETAPAGEPTPEGAVGPFDLLEELEQFRLEFRGQVEEAVEQMLQRQREEVAAMLAFLDAAAPAEA